MHRICGHQKVDAGINDPIFILFQERGGADTFNHESLALKYKLDNEFELIFVVSTYVNILTINVIVHHERAVLSPTRSFSTVWYYLKPYDILFPKIYEPPNVKFSTLQPLCGWSQI